MYIPMVTSYAQPWVKTCVNVSPEFHRLAREHHIKFSEALRVGISLLLADRGVTEYDTNLNVMRKMNKITKELQEISQKYHDLKKT